MKEISHGFQTASSLTYDLMKYHSKNMRRKPTIDEYIADFVCLNEMLVIEVDGEYHLTEEQQEADKLRTERLNTLGFRVIRFTNDEVLYNINNVLDIIRKSFVFSDPE